LAGWESVVIQSIYCRNENTQSTQLKTKGSPHINVLKRRLI
jgi:hypothetical protein